MTDVLIMKNRIAIARRAQFGITVVGGSARSARRNSVTCVRLVGNRIAGTRKAVSVAPNIMGARGNRAALGRC